MKNCPFCAEEIQEAAIKCKHCGEMLNTRSPRLASELGRAGGAGAVGARNLVKWVAMHARLLIITSVIALFVGPIAWMTHVEVEKKAAIDRSERLKDEEAKRAQERFEREGGRKIVERVNLVKQFLDTCINHGDVSGFGDNGELSKVANHVVRSYQIQGFDRQQVLAAIVFESKAGLEPPKQYYFHFSGDYFDAKKIYAVVSGE